MQVVVSWALGGRPREVAEAMGPEVPSETLDAARAGVRVARETLGPVTGAESEGGDAARMKPG